MQHDGESSVEEILESIKKVIARDNRADAMQTRRRRAEEGMAAHAPEPADDDEAEEVLELGESEMVAEDEVDEALSVDDLGDSDGDEAAPALDDAPLIAENVRASMQDNFAALSMLAEPGAAPQIVRSGETSLEGMVRDMLRPMLSDWLDANLPAMVERMVKSEISRIAGKRS